MSSTVTAAPAASPSSRRSRASGSRSRPTTSSTRPASGPTGSAPRWSRRRTCRGSPPVAAPMSCSTAPTCSTGSAACIVPAGEGRAIFALPWYGRTLVGTTDNDYDGDIDHPSPGSDDVEYLLDAVNAFFGISLSDSDLVGAYAGVRPLIATGDPKKSVDISRKAELYETSSGMLTITGGKLTTWRRMAKQTVDRLVEREGREAPCHTAEIPLGMEARPEDLEAPDGVGEESIAPARLPLRARRAHGPRHRPRGAEAGGADRLRAPRPARRGGGRGAAGAGAQRRRRAAAPHPAGDARRAAAARRLETCGRSPRRSAPSWAGRGGRSASARPRRLAGADSTNLLDP